MRLVTKLEGQRQRATALLLALAFLAVQLGSLLHFAVERHQVCADHGELVHGAHGSHAGSAADAAHEPRGTGEPQSASRLVRAPQSGEHEHCAWMPVLPPSDPPRLAPALARAPSQVLALRLGESRARPALSPLALAPKQSPPA